MSDVVLIKTLEEMMDFANKRGIVEIAMRGRNKRFSAFQKIMINNAQQGEAKEKIQQALNLLNKNNALAEGNMKLLGNLSKLQYANLILNGLNLCATCAGFAIMYVKLDKMSNQINQLMNMEKRGTGVQAKYEFNKILSEHQNMLDARKTQKYYTEEQMRELVDSESNVLSLLVDIYMEDLAADQEMLIFSIFSLASMLAVSLRFFDEIYYFNNKEAIGDGDVWHSSHNNWMKVLDRLTKTEFIKRLQDHGIFDLRLSTFETDAYYISLVAQVKNLMEEVSDNQELIVAMDDVEELNSFINSMNQGVSNSIRDAFEQTEGIMEDEEIVESLQKAMKEVALTA
ncbi:MAG: hypothetical protein PHX08_05235 [Lachnospiraceae bacterium]|nr:hypothetical protein [Lachnospiraceae bacterium]